MKTSDYTKPILFFIIYLILFGILSGFYFYLNTPSLTPLLPDINKGGQLGIMFFIVYPLVTIAGAVVGGYSLAPLYLVLHKKIIGRKMTYGIQEKPSSTKFHKTLQGFFPTLIALNFALMLGPLPLVYRSIISSMYWGAPGENVFAAILTLLMFFLGISAFIFSPIWFLLDGGIIYTNKEKVENKDKPIEIRAVGGWYLFIMKGYAGISVIIEYVLFFDLFLRQMLTLAFHDVVIALIIFIPFPITLTFVFIPAIIILDIFKERRKKYIRKCANKFGISDILEVKIEKLVNK
ncbi:MAG: hypothetical protein ACFE9C_13990 [Candidatus Hodarchaeota archaeon]